MAADQLERAAYHRERHLDNDGWDNVWKAASPRVKARYTGRPSRLQLALHMEVRAEFYLDRVNWATRDTAAVLISNGWAGSDLAELIETAKALLA